MSLPLTTEIPCFRRLLTLLGMAAAFLGLELKAENSIQRSYVLENDNLRLEVAAPAGTLRALDKRNHHTWTQTAVAGYQVHTVTTGRGTLRLEFRATPATAAWQAEIRLDPIAPEFRVTLSGNGPLTEKVAWPHPFVSSHGSRLIIPVNEGISFPVDDPAVPILRFPAYSGHGLSMPFFGEADGEAAHLVMLESPDDAALQLGRSGTSLYAAPEWEPQKGAWGYARSLRYVFFDRGGFVAMCKYYRAQAVASGLLHTLVEKRRANHSIDLLVGAANIWCWEDNPVALVDEMQALGMTRLLWSNGQPPAVVAALNARGVLTSSYDIYKDVMDPAVFPKLGHVNPLWTTAAWPADIVLDASGQWVHGWRVTGRQGEDYWCASVCDLRATDYARQRIPADLRTHPYRARMLDTATASAFLECYNPAHPSTRTESKHGRFRLMQFIAQDQHLVLGTENGMDFAVPEVAFFEGMMSIDPFRLPQSGRNMRKIWETVPASVERFQVGHDYRLPLWELVYHDCVTSFWYWGDYNNKLTPIWAKRDLFNVLYGTPPLYMFDRKLWAAEKDRFARSYRAIAPTVRAAGYAEMTDFRMLTVDRRVQQSQFANGLVVTVNFGDRPYRLPDGRQVPPTGFVVDAGAPDSAPPISSATPVR